MQLLVSVRSPEEALDALVGGADIVDGKDPAAGALGPLSLGAFAAIVEAMAGRRPVSAALGEASDGDEIEHRARAFVGAGAAFVKVGFAGASSRAQIDALTRAAIRGAGRSRLVTVAYADDPGHVSLEPGAVIEASAAAGVAGVLLDTIDKSGPPLTACVSRTRLDAWVAKARQRGLFVALAGKLTAADLDDVVACGARIFGVRGAACGGDRCSDVSAERVRWLRDKLDSVAGVDMHYGPKRSVHVS